MQARCNEASERSVLGCTIAHGAWLLENSNTIDAY